MEYIANKDKKSFQDIIFQQISKILELSCEEFRGGYTDKKIVGGVVEEIYIPDSRKRVVQSIEFLGILLEPELKKEKESNKRYKELLKKIEENLKKHDDDKINYENFIVTKLKLMKKVFREFSFLLHKLDYLKGKGYSESIEEDVELTEENLQ